MINNTLPSLSLSSLTNPPKKKVAGVLPTPSTSSSSVGTNPFSRLAQTPSSVSTLISNPTSAPSADTSIKSSSGAITPGVTPTALPKSYTTPSGATVSESGSLLTPPPASPAPSPVRGLFPDTLSSIRDIASRPSPVTEEATKQVLDLNRQLSQSRQNQITATGQQELAPIPKGVAFGRQGVVQRQYEQQQAAIASQLGALKDVASLGVQQQQAQLGGLQSAAGLAAPQLSQFGQTFYSPTTGESSGNAQFTQALEQYAQMAANNQMGAIPSSITSNPVLNAQVMARAQQINPAFNFNTAQGTAAAQQGSASIAGLTVPQANQAVYQSAFGDYTNMNRLLQDVDKLGSLLVTTAQGGDINPFAPQFVNQTIAAFRNQLSSEGQARFTSTLATFQNAAQALLAQSDGTTPSGVQAQVEGIANGSLQLGALKGLVDQAKIEGQIKLANQAGVVNNALSNILGGTGGGGGTITWDSI